LIVAISRGDPSPDILKADYDLLASGFEIGTLGTFIIYE
jgi:hypothetical protein